ncbi:MAG: hypothetical protein WA004_20135 [Saprospiraceae bacterium]
MKIAPFSGVIALACALVLALSCTKESAPAEDANEALELRGPTVPFHGEYTVYPQTVSEENGIVTLILPAEGVATHLGNSQWFSNSQANFNTLPPIQTGDMEFTAANGAKLYGHFEGTGTPNPDGSLSGEGNYWITGGDGRFSGYTGSGAYHFTVSTENIGTLFFDGTLTKP